MEPIFLSTLEELFKTLSLNKKLVIKDKNLISFSNKKIQSPVGDIFPLLTRQKSNLKDQFVEIEKFKKLITILSENNAVVRLNHVGCCYKIDSQGAEEKRLFDLINDSQFHLYVEPSNDDGVWFFIGNSDKWQEMMIELIPVVSTSDKWKEYWLPHIQIDIDTTLSEEEIIEYVQSVFGKEVTPFPIEIDGIVYIVRNRLGTVGGINIMLDLATKARNVQFQRQKLLKEIV